MTTIAYKGGRMAGDTAMSRGATIQAGIIKVHRREIDGALIGFCGAAAWGRSVTAWFMGGEKGERPEGESTPDNCDTALIARPDGTLEVHETASHYELRGVAYYAMGSGRDQALGALFAGADVETAIRASIAHDAYTGGEVTVVAT